MEPPQNIEAEQALLGSILVNNASFHRTAEFLKGEHFANALHGKLYDTLARLIEKGQVVSLITLKTYLEHDDAMKAAGGTRYLASLAAASVHASDAGSYAQTIHDLFLRRQLVEVGHTLTNAALRPTSELTALDQIEKTERQLYDLAATGQLEGGFKPFATSLTAAIISAESAYHRSGQLTGIATGLTDVDKLLGGLHRSDLVIVAGRPSMGKTALATNMAFHIVKAYREDTSAEGRVVIDGGVVGFFSLEMSGEQLATRILSEQALVSSERIRRGDLGSKDFDRVITISQELETLKLFIDDTPALTISALRTRARRLKRQHGLGLLVVDYLQLLSPAGRSRADNRVNEVSEITRGLKTLAKELDVPVLALSQLSRAVEQREDKRPQLSDLRDSGSIEQDADVVMFVYREAYYLERAQPSQREGEGDLKFMQRCDAWEARKSLLANQAEVIVAKQRHGPTGVVKLAFEGQFTRFSDIQETETAAGL